MQRRSGPIGKTVRFEERFSSFLYANAIICQLCLSYAIQIIFIFSIQNNHGAGFIERQTWILKRRRPYITSNSAIPISGYLRTRYVNLSCTTLRCKFLCVFSRASADIRGERIRCATSNAPTQLLSSICIKLSHNPFAAYSKQNQN